MKKLTTEEFIEKAITIHGDMYDYSLVEYVGNKFKVEIICKIHGTFLQNPDHHLRGHGCLKCGGNYKKTTKDFIEEVEILHNNIYTYENVIYLHPYSKVDITCKIHGTFSQTPNGHLRGLGCALCSNKKLSIKKSAKSKLEFKDKAIVLHGDKYDYLLVDYINNKTNVKIICKTHGIFNQLPSNHLHGRGCPSCANYGFNSSKPAYHYYIRFDRPNYNSLYKVGISNNIPKKRLTGMRVFSDWTPTILQELYFENGQDALDLETLHKQTFKEFQYTGEPIMQNGNTELFTKDILA